MSLPVARVIGSGSGFQISLDPNRWKIFNTEVSGTGSGLEKIVDPDSICLERLDPVCDVSLDPDTVKIRHDPKTCL